MRQRGPLASVMLGWVLPVCVAVVFAVGMAATHHLPTLIRLALFVPAGVALVIVVRAFIDSSFSKTLCPRCQGAQVPCGLCLNRRWVSEGDKDVFTGEQLPP